MEKLVKTILGFNAASLIRGVRVGPSRFLLACQRSCTAARPLETRPLASIPEVETTDILAGRRPLIRLRVMEYEDGMLPLEQATALMAILAAEQPKEVLEIGTYMGHSTRLMAENLEHSTIHTVDLPPDFTGENTPGMPPKDDYHLIQRRVVGREYKGTPCESRIVQHFADTAKWNFAEAGHPTFFFIDGSHSYEYCRNDSERCLALAGGKGVFLWHDCDEWHPGVVKLLCEWRRAGRNIQRIRGTFLAYCKLT
jgi:hypothetical protein